MGKRKKFLFYFILFRIRINSAYFISVSVLWNRHLYSKSNGAAHAVSLERFWVARNKTRFQKAKGKQMAKILIPLTILIVMTSLLHDPFHRESIVDPHLDYGRRAWCIVQFSTSLVRIYNMIINIIHYVAPFAVSLISTIFILIAFTRTRVKSKKQEFKMVFKEQLSLLKH